VALVLGPEAFEEDCRLATIVISAREAPPGCAALTIDQRILRTQGATTLRREGEHWLVTAARPIGQDRPWAWAQPVRHQDHTFGRRPKPTDATPSLEGLEARY
jgi:competence protein ComEC